MTAKPSNELEFLMASVERGQIAGLTHRRNRVFCNNLLRRAKSLKQNADDEFLASRYREEIHAASAAANDALVELRKAFYGRPNGQYRVILEEALIKPHVPSESALDEMIIFLNSTIHGTRISRSRKSVALEQRIANLTAKLLIEELQTKPTHESGFSTKSFRKDCLYPCNSGDVTAYDDIMTALSVILEIEFSDPVLRKVRGLATR